MARNLADETLAAILEQCLAVPDNDFTCTNSRASPFANIREPSSNYLVVCKRWMRICTPLLYHTIVLRSQPQATALAAVLKPKAHLEFGRHIRNIRIEGGFGAATKQILLAAPNITDICVTLDLYATDKVEPMCSVMATAFKPRHLILASSFDWRTRSNKQINMMLETLQLCVRTWTSLTSVTTSDQLFRSHDLLGQYISSATHIREICLSEGVLFLRLSEVAELARQPHLDRIIIRQTVSSLDSEQSQLGLGGLDNIVPELRAKLVFNEEAAPARVAETAKIIAAQDNPFFTPLANVPRPLRRMIWSLILAAAINLSATASKPNTSLFQLLVSPNAKYSIEFMLVCREWAELVRSIRAVRPLLRTAAGATNYVDFIRGSDLGWRTTSVKVSELGWAHKDRNTAEQIIYPSLVLLPLLHTLKAHIEMSPQAWSSFCAGPAPSIVVLAVSLSSGRFQIPHMPLLTHMDFSINHTYDIELHTMHDCAFPMLARLEVRDFTRDATLLSFFASQRLPTLGDLGFATTEDITFESNDILQRAAVRLEERLTPFLSRHGPTLKTITNYGWNPLIKLILRCCPILVSLDIRDVAGLVPTPDELHLDHPHQSLEELQLPILYDDSDDAKVIAAMAHPWSEFFDAVRPIALPKLRKIVVNQRDMWPTTTRKSSKYPLLAVAETLWERGVRLCDANEVYWKPRLQGRGRKR